MPFHPCRESEDDRAIVLIAYWATGAMMPRRSAKVWLAATSSLFSRSATPNMEVDWADGVGSSSGRSLGSISFGDCASVMRNDPTSMKHFCPWLALSSAGTLSKGIAEEERSGERTVCVVSAHQKAECKLLRFPSLLRARACVG